MKAFFALAGGALLLAGTLPPSTGKIRLAPADDRAKPIGAAARAKNGPDPTVRPADDIGMADDPVVPPVLSAPAQRPVTGTSPR